MQSCCSGAVTRLFCPVCIIISLANVGSSFLARAYRLLGFEGGHQSADKMIDTYWPDSSDGQ